MIAYTRSARATVRNTCRAHEETVVRRFGRAALLRETEFGALLACRLREKHGVDVQVERTKPFNEFTTVPESVIEAARAYETREKPSTPYPKFVAGTEHPSPTELRGVEL